MTPMFEDMDVPFSDFRDFMGVGVLRIFLPEPDVGAFSAIRLEY